MEDIGDGAEDHRPSPQNHTIGFPMGGARPRWPRLGQRGRGEFFVGRLAIGFKHDPIAALGRQEVRPMGNISRETSRVGVSTVQAMFVIECVRSSQSRRISD